jgi:hypothetical protein
VSATVAKAAASVERLRRWPMVTAADGRIFLFIGSLAANRRSIVASQGPTGGSSFDEQLMR